MSSWLAVDRGCGVDRQSINNHLSFAADPLLFQSLNPTERGKRNHTGNTDTAQKESIKEHRKETSISDEDNLQSSGVSTYTAIANLALTEPRFTTIAAPDTNPPAAK